MVLISASLGSGKVLLTRLGLMCQSVTDFSGALAERWSGFCTNAHSLFSARLQARSGRLQARSGRLQALGCKLVGEDGAVQPRHLGCHLMSLITDCP